MLVRRVKFTKFVQSLQNFAGFSQKVVSTLTYFGGIGQLFRCLTRGDLASIGGIPQGVWPKMFGCGEIWEIWTDEFEVSGFAPVWADRGL